MINWKTKAKFIFYLKKLNRTGTLSYKGENIPRHFISYLMLLTIFKTIGVPSNLCLIIFCFLMFAEYFYYLCFKHQYQQLNPNYKNVLDKILFRKRNSVKLQLELNKLDLAMQSNSDVYKSFSSDDFPYLTKLIRRYERYNDFKEKQNNNESAYHNDLDKLNKTKESNPQLLLTMDNVDDELNNLINNKFKNLNNEKQFNVIETTNKNHTSTNKESNTTWY